MANVHIRKDLYKRAVLRGIDEDIAGTVNRLYEEYLDSTESEKDE